MTAPTRRALLRELSAQPNPERRFGETNADQLSDDFILLLRFASECCGVAPLKLTPLDLMARLSNLKGARKG